MKRVPYEYFNATDPCPRFEFCHLSEHIQCSNGHPAKYGQNQKNGVCIRQFLSCEHLQEMKRTFERICISKFGSA